jgi:hypothetical protein
MQQIMNGQSGDQQGLLAKILGMNGQGAQMGQPTMTGSPQMSPQISASGPLDKLFGKATGK